VKITGINGKGTDSRNEYSFPVELLNGRNILRVKQIDYFGKTNYSISVCAISSMPKVTFEQRLDQILFSKQTFFELYDSHGNLFKKNKSSFIDLSNLPKGKYFLNYGNQMKKIKIK